MHNASLTMHPLVTRAHANIGRVARLLGWRCIKRSLICLVVASRAGSVERLNTRLPTSTLYGGLVIALSYISLETFQESDAEKSDQDLVVDVANEVRPDFILKRLDH